MTPLVTPIGIPESISSLDTPDKVLDWIKSGNNSCDIASRDWMKDAPSRPIPNCTTCCRPTTWSDLTCEQRRRVITYLPFFIHPWRGSYPFSVYAHLPKEGLTLDDVPLIAFISTIPYLSGIAHRFQRILRKLMLGN